MFLHFEQWLKNSPTAYQLMIKGHYDTFSNWFTETVGYGSRDETFWEAVRYSDDKMAYDFLKTAWRLGYEAGRRAEI